MQQLIRLEVTQSRCGMRRERGSEVAAAEIEGQLGFLRGDGRHVKERTGEAVEEALLCCVFAEGLEVSREVGF